MDHENQELSPTVSQSGEPQEVVLRYEAHAAPIVERYVQPTPLPGNKEPIAPPPRRRKGLKIFLLCMLGLILLSGTISVLWFSGVFDSQTSYEDDRFEHHSERRYYDSDEHGETTIKRLPNTDKVKLRYSETHGKALTIQEIYQKVNPSTVTVLTGMNTPGCAAPEAEGMVFEGWSPAVAGTVTADATYVAQWSEAEEETPEAQKSESQSEEGTEAAVQGEDDEIGRAHV